MSAAVTWLQNSLGVDVTGEWARHVHLNVGVVLYNTRRHTLRSLREHPLFGAILSGHAHKCEDGSFLIDGDGALFRYILEYLRHGTLTVPENFEEWEMLLHEVRQYQLPELEQLVLDRFEYQRCVFKKQLPYGVYVWWPTSIATSHHASTNASGGQQGDKPSTRTPLHPPTPPQQYQQQQYPSSQPPPVSRHAEKHGDRSSSPPPTATTTITAFSNSASASNDVAASPAALPSAHAAVRIVPPLPGLEVDAATGASVIFRRGQVLHDLDQLITVLLTAYGYNIQHWDEARGRVLLTLSGAL